MTVPHPQRRPRRLACTLAVLAAVAAAPPAASAQGVGAFQPDDVRAPVIDVPEVELPRLPAVNGALVFHGNYCGPGSRGAGRPPVDALDAACMRHDACSPPLGAGLPRCGCHARLYREAAAVARARGTPDDVRVAAQFVSEGARVLACR